MTVGPTRPCLICGLGPDFCDSPDHTYSPEMIGDKDGITYFDSEKETIMKKVPNPDEILNEMRDIAGEMLVVELDEKTHKERGDRLAQLTEWLDERLRNGERLPDPWTRTGPALTHGYFTELARDRLTDAENLANNIYQGPIHAQIAAVYMELARTASDREQRAQIIGDVGSPPPPRRLLCYRCVSEATEGQVIQEAMTIVNGTALCHEHGEDRWAVANRGGPKC